MGVVSPRGDGPYQLILQEAASRAGITINENVAPLKNAVADLVNKKSLAIYGMTDTLIAQLGQDNIITSYPLGLYKLHLFTRKGEPAISGYQQLASKQVVGVLGYEVYYSELVARGVALSYVSNELSQMKQFIAHDADVIVGFLPDWLPHIKQLNYAASFPVRVGYDMMTARNTPEGRRFINKISVALQAMHRDGTIKALMGQRYDPFVYRPNQPYQWRAEQPF
ncbi:transporter substrate-binding domain-containing protein [Dasania marina]|uniref:transporter substrate-binding domain-containing protein n=1 Tax=Dasania marina TaxID=471499 RepID=UPI0004B24C29|nr:transporter substrate-binding domain-containing protein [Dasania marina]